MDFIAIDVETANRDMASICQIGLVRYRQGELVEEWMTYVNPQDYFHGFNINIHGIQAAMVQDAPTFGEIAEKLYAFCDRHIVVSHTGFDRAAICRAAEKHDLVYPDWVWLDSAQVVRRVWKQFSRRGYGLKNICSHLGYEFTHHDALEDAKAAAHVMLKAMEVSRLNLNDWLKKNGVPSRQHFRR